MSLVVKVTLDIKPGKKKDPVTGKKQTQAEAEAEFLNLFREHVERGSLIDDYGKGAWGGYDGPYVKKATVAPPE